MLDNIPFSLNQIITCAMAALILTSLVMLIIKLKRLWKGFKGFMAQNPNVGQIVSKCYELFPMDKLEFHGRIITRGNKIRIITAQNVEFMGEFIGTNAKRMVCIKTDKAILAHDINNIRDIETLN